MHSKGFIWEEDSTSATDLLVAVAILAMQILLQLYIKRHIFDIVSQCLEEDTLWRSCVWTAGDCFSTLGALLLAPDAVTLLLIGLVGGVPFAVLSIISWLIIVASSVWWGIVGWVNAHRFPPDPMIRWPFSQKTRYFSLFFGYVIFANIVA